jgi:hypothetical protein
MASFLTVLIGSGIGPSLSPPLHEREAGSRCGMLGISKLTT